MVKYAICDIKRTKGITMSIIKRLAGLRPAMLAMLASSAVLSGCATAPAPPLPASEYGQANQPYTLGVGDKLRVNVYREPELSGEFSVNGTGAITMPLVGTVRARGLTPAELARAITARLRAGYIREPYVAVEVEAYRPFFILGEVTAPGQYPYVPNMTVESAVAIAGGFSPRAQKASVELTRTDRSGAVRAAVPLGTLMRPGDTVVVGERWF